jgi:hypothetical protein
LLRATPMEIGGKRKGTFELWHRSSREHPVAGDIVTHIGKDGILNSFDGILGALDEPYKPIPFKGITLADCIASSPLMLECARSARLDPLFIRGNCVSERWPANSDRWPGDQWRELTTITFHPNQLNEAFLQTIAVQPKFVPQIEVNEVGQGVRVHLSNDWIYGRAGLSLPPAATVSTSEWRMWTNSPVLNEFGYLYVALFLAGNYARYYPDKWLFDVEHSRPLALAIEELCSIAEWRVPWVTLCELEMTLFVQGS